MKEFDLSIHGNEYKVKILSMLNEAVKVEVNGVLYDVELNKKQSKTPVIKRSKIVHTTIEHGKLTNKNNELASVKAPIPGVIFLIKIKIGDAVKIGDTLLILEAMKMQNEIQSSKEGVVKDIKVTEGQNVYEGDVLVIIE